MPHAADDGGQGRQRESEQEQPGRRLQPKLQPGVKHISRGQITKSHEIAPEEEQWKDIGSGIVARTFRGVERLFTTTRSGPSIGTVKRRVIRNCATGKIIDDCFPDDVPDRLLNRRVPAAIDIRIELTLKEADRLYKQKGSDIVEIFSPPRVAQEAGLRRYAGRKLVPGWSLDTTMPDPLDGEAWDLGRTSKKKRLRELVSTGRPYVLIGSPPCTAFSRLQGLNKGRRGENKAKQKLTEAIGHMKLCCELYTEQHKNGAYFIHEHPEGADSWTLKCVIALEQLPGVQKIRIDQCFYGAKSTHPDGTEGPAQKPTVILTNAPEVVKMLERAQCPNRADRAAGRAKTHTHAQLVGGRAGQAQVYPRELCRDICIGISHQRRADELGVVGMPLLSVETMNDIAKKAREQARRSMPLNDCDDDLCLMSAEVEEDPSAALHGKEPEAWAETAYDDVSGKTLDPKEVRRARREEIDYFKSMKVYEKVPISEAWSTTGRAPIAVRWIDTNKGDTLNPVYRSRLVAK